MNFIQEHTMFCMFLHFWSIKYADSFIIFYRQLLGVEWL